MSSNEEAIDNGKEEVECKKVIERKKEQSWEEEGKGIQGKK